MRQLFNLIIGEGIQFLEIFHLPLCVFVHKDHIIGDTFTLL